LRTREVTLSVELLRTWQFQCTIVRYQVWTWWRWSLPVLTT